MALTELYSNNKVNCTKLAIPSSKHPTSGAILHTVDANASTVGGRLVSDSECSVLHKPICKQDSMDTKLGDIDPEALWRAHGQRILPQPPSDWVPDYNIVSSEMRAAVQSADAALEGLRSAQVDGDKLHRLYSQLGLDAAVDAGYHAKMLEEYAKFEPQLAVHHAINSFHKDKAISRGEDEV